MRKPVQMLVVLVFLLYIAAPVLSLAVGERAQEVENRPLQDFPPISLVGLLDGTTFEGVRGYLSDRLPARTLAIRAAASVDFWLFGDSADPSRVLVGDDRWLFLRSTFDDACEPDVNPDRVARNIVRLADAFHAADVPFVLVVAPDKSALYPEKLNSELTALARCAIAARAQLRSQLRAVNPRGWLDTWSLLEARKQNANSLVYFRDDSHLTPLGAGVWVAAAIERVSPGLWEDEDFRPSGRPARVGNLVEFMGLAFAEEVQWWSVDRPGIEVRKVGEFGSRFSPAALASQLYESESTTGEANLGGRLVMLKDSFNDIAEPMIAPYFSASSMADWRDEASVEKWLDELATGDVVIMETAEHNVWDRLGDNDFVDAAIASILSQVESER